MQIIIITVFATVALGQVALEWFVLFLHRLITYSAAFIDPLIIIDFMTWGDYAAR